MFQARMYMNFPELHAGGRKTSDVLHEKNGIKKNRQGDFMS
jgi:hypothetical protein